MSKLSNCLKNKEQSLPIWFMRQAGRYLPEFKQIRKNNKDFIKLCLDSDLSSEITLQPMKRYDLDAAIIFSDILIVPYALGQRVEFIKNQGPSLEDFNYELFFKNKLKNFSDKLSPIYNAISLTRKKLNKDKSLISFIGAPWTLCLYMLNLKSEEDNINLLSFEKNENIINEIIPVLEEFLIKHIENQIDAGSDVVQIFDSWAGLLPRKNLKDFCYQPNQRIVEFCKKKNIPTICFPKGIGKNYKEFVNIVKPSCISIDHEVDPNWAKNNLNNVCIQGGMSPKTLLESTNKIFREVDRYLEIFSKTAYIFNLGHGVLPQTNPDTIHEVINRVRKYK